MTVLDFKNKQKNLPNSLASSLTIEWMFEFANLKIWIGIRELCFCNPLNYISFHCVTISPSNEQKRSSFQLSKQQRSDEVLVFLLPLVKGLITLLRRRRNPRRGKPQTKMTNTILNCRQPFNNWSIQSENNIGSGPWQHRNNRNHDNITGGKVYRSRGGVLAHQRRRD